MTVFNAIPTWSYTPLKRTFPSEDPFFQVRKFYSTEYFFKREGSTVEALELSFYKIQQASVDKLWLLSCFILHT